MTKTLARALSLGLVLAGFAVVSAEARRWDKPTLAHERSIDAALKFDRHAIHIFGGDDAIITERVLRKVRSAGIKQLRKKHQRRYDRSRVAVKLARPVPGTLGAYRKTVAMDGAAAVTKGLGNIHGLQRHFITKLAALKVAMPAALGFSVGSGFRSRAEQARLHALKPRLAARPGRSQHEKGLAGDLRFVGRGAARWVHTNARKYGLWFPMRHEPWHIEPVGGTRYAAKHHRRYASVR